MTKLGICMISTFFYPCAGGAEKQAERLSAWLVQHGVAVTVVTRHFDHLPNYEILHGGVDVYRVRALPGKVLGSLSFTLLGLLLLLHRRNTFDIIHCHQIFSPSTLGWLASRWLGCPLIINLHGGGSKGELHRLLHRLVSGRLRLEALKRDADAFVAISEEIGEELRNQGVPEEKIHFLGNGVDPEQFCPVDSVTRMALRERLRLPIEIPLFTFVGRLVPGKGLNVLFAAWERVSPPAQLIVVGDGPLVDELQELASISLEGRVMFIGKVDNVVEYLQASDAWVLPSYSEGLPVSLLEAMACGLPVVTTSVGAIPEVVEHGINGLIIPPGSSELLSEALQLLIDYPSRAREMGRHARCTILSRYSMDHIAEGYLRLYEQTYR